MKLYLHFFNYLFIIIFSLSLFASDECDLLVERLKDKTEFALDENIRFQKTYFDNYEYPKWVNGVDGFFIKLDLDKDNSSGYTPYFRDKNNNIKLYLIAPELLITFENIDQNDISNSTVLKINDLKTEGLLDNEIRSLLPAKSIEILTENGDVQLLEFGDDFPYQNEIALQLFIEQISNLDSASSTFDAQFIEKFFYHQLGLEQIGIDIFEEVYGNDDQDFAFRTAGFHCKFDNEEIRNLGLFYPNTILSNAIDEEIIFESVTYWFSIWDESDYQAYWEKTTVKSASIKSDFSYESFPFDSQKLYFKYEVINDLISYPYISVNTPIYNSMKNIKLDNWTVKSFDFFNYLNLSHETGFKNDIGLEINFLMERSYIYYLTKVYLPIVIILFVTLSTLFIHPKELESRLTVAVVCFLALIAYTYVVEKDLPQLSYLTAMDKMILISYFFAALPTFQSIIVHNLYLKNSEYAVSMNNKSKIYIPITYFILIMLNVLITVSNSENTISALKFTI